MIKRAFYLYQRSLWYLGQARGEINKVPTDTPMLLLTFLAVRGIKPTIPETILGFIILGILGIVIGKFLVSLGVPAYNQRLNNAQNLELMEIRELLKEIKGKLDEKALHS